MKQVFAYRFTTELTLPQVFERLNEEGPWRWSMRDSDRWGDYMSTLAFPDYAMVKLFAEPDHYAVNVLFESERSEGPMELHMLKTILLDSLLPAIGARDVTPTATYD